MKNKKINDEYRHKYHLMPPKGWMSDPNGFSRFNGLYHLFYQHYPHDTICGPMHWGHATSADMITWNTEAIALKPSEPYDENGVFSGSALQVGDEHWVYYTGHVDTDLSNKYDASFMRKDTPTHADMIPFVRQTQCLAISKDGINYTKYENNPVIGSDQIPEGIQPGEFRDPKVWTHNDMFYMVVGAKTTDDIGAALFYQSDDGLTWEYLNKLSLGKSYGSVWECPDLIDFEDKQGLMFSMQEKFQERHRYQNIQGTIVLIGVFDHKTGVFDIESEHELDQGFDFYAPQSTLDKQGNKTAIAWMNMWDRNYPLHERSHGWNGSMTLPRQLTLEGDKIYQKPHPSIEKYLKKTNHAKDITVKGEYRNSDLSGISQRIRMSFTIHGGSFTVNLFESADEKLILRFDKKNHEVTLDRGNTKVKIDSIPPTKDFIRTHKLDCTKEITLDVFLDVSSAEIFINNGEHVFTTLFFSESRGSSVSLHSQGETEVHELEKWTIKEGGHNG